MKRIILTLFIIFSNFSIAQTEQISLDYFSNNLMPKIKNKYIYFDGKVLAKSNYESEKNDNEDSVTDNILFDYSQCKNRNIKNNKNTYELEYNFKLNDMIKFSNVRNSTATNLIIPKNIKFRKILVNKKRMKSYFWSKINKIFPQKYNLKISPSIEIEKDVYLTRISITKQDFSYGQYFDIIVKQSKVIDYCETYWIQ